MIPERKAGRPRGPWLAAAALFAVAAGLAAWREIARRPPAEPEPPPEIVAGPAHFALVAGRWSEGVVGRRALLAFPDGAEIALREDSRVAIDRAGALRVRLDAGQVFVDGGGDVVVSTPDASFLANGAIFDLRRSERGSVLAVAHGSVIVASGTFRVEISRDESVDVAPGGAIGKAMRIDVGPSFDWATALIAQTGRLRNGGFEADFDGWDAPSYPESGVGIDRRAHGGRRSAIVRFNSVREYRHESPASAPFESVSRRLRLRGYAEHADLEFGPEGGACLEVLDAAGAVLARSPVWTGTSGWRKFAVDFDRPEGSGPLRVVCRRLENGAPAQGRLRLDDVQVFELAPAGP